MGFTFPKDDKPKHPVPVYLQLEGKTIYMVRWELNISSIVLNCPSSCRNGILIHQEYDFYEDASTTAFWKASEDIDFAYSMKYKCDVCQEQCKANDGRLLTSMRFCNAYPVDPRSALPEEPIHLHQSLSRLIEVMLVKKSGNLAKDGNSVESFAEVLQQLQRKKHAELCYQYLEQSQFTTKHNPDSGTLVDLLAFPKIDE